MEGSRPFLTEIGMESIQRGGNGLRARRSCPISLSRGLARKKKARDDSRGATVAP